MKRIVILTGILLLTSFSQTLNAKDLILNQLNGYHMDSFANLANVLRSILEISSECIDLNFIRKNKNREFNGEGSDQSVTWLSSKPISKSELSEIYRNACQYPKQRPCYFEYKEAQMGKQEMKNEALFRFKDSDSSFRTALNDELIGAIAPLSDSCKEEVKNSSIFIRNNMSPQALLWISTIDQWGQSKIKEPNELYSLSLTTKFYRRIFLNNDGFSEIRSCHDFPFRFDYWFE